MAILGALLGAILGYAVTLALAYALAGALGARDAEGKRASLAAFLYAPIGGFVGLLGGFVLFNRLWPGLAPGLWIALALVAVPAALLTGRWLRRPLGMNRAAPRLQVEIEGATGTPRLSLETPEGEMPGTLRPTTGGALAGEVELYHRTRRRVLVVESGGERLRLSPGLPATPRDGDWSAWQVLRPGMRLRWRVVGAG